MTKTCTSCEPCYVVETQDSLRKFFELQQHQLHCTLTIQFNQISLQKFSLMGKKNHKLGKITVVILSTIK